MDEANAPPETESWLFADIETLKAYINRLLGQLKRESPQDVASLADFTRDRKSLGGSTDEAIEDFAIMIDTARRLATLAPLLENTIRELRVPLGRDTGLPRKDVKGEHFERRAEDAATVLNQMNAESSALALHLYSDRRREKDKRLFKRRVRKTVVRIRTLLHKISAHLLAFIRTINSPKGWSIEFGIGIGIPGVTGQTTLALHYE